MNYGAAGVGNKRIRNNNGAEYNEFLTCTYSRINLHTARMQPAKNNSFNNTYSNLADILYECTNYKRKKNADVNLIHWCICLLTFKRWIHCEKKNTIKLKQNIKNRISKIQSCMKFDWCHKDRKKWVNYIKWIIAVKTLWKLGNKYN